MPREKTYAEKQLDRVEKKVDAVLKLLKPAAKPAKKKK